MNLDNLNKWLTLSANLGVLLGIVFLALELRQSTNMTRAQTRDAMTEKQLEFYSHVISDTGAAIAWESLGDRELPSDERINDVKGNLLLLYQLRMWENELYQYRQGLFETQEFESRLALWRVLTS